MRSLIGPAGLAITSSVLAIVALPAAAVAQTGANQEAVEEIVTIGTRRQGRSAIDTAVPLMFLTRKSSTVCHPMISSTS